VSAINLINNELPDNWVITKLSDFAHIDMGQSPASDTYNLDGQGLPFFQGKSEFGHVFPEIAYSRPRLPLIPDEACHPFHAKAATDSTAKLPPWQAA
jgi:hypothetical protein